MYLRDRRSVGARCRAEEKEMVSVVCKAACKILCHGFASTAAMVGMVWVSCGAYAAEPEVANFACNGDVSSAASGILTNYRDGVGDVSRLPGSTDGLKALLAAMRRGDQGIQFLAIGLMGRCGLRPDSDAMRAVMLTGRTIGEANKDLLGRIIQEKGWPVISIYGEEADQSAFLIAQHADRDPMFQKYVLKILEEKLRIKETSGENYALLFDRVRIAEAKPQRYGTQGDCNGNQWVPKKMESPMKVDQLRKSVGLEPMAAYRKKASSLICARAD